jgi:hypothetical protein
MPLAADCAPFCPNGHRRGVTVPLMPAYDERVGNAQRAEVIDQLTRALDGERLPLHEYDRRVAAVGAATYASELAAQVDDLPDEYGWRPHALPAPVVPPRPARSYERTALVLGILSLPLSVCLLGWIFGILAILYSRRGHPPVFGPALIGRVFGIVGILLSVGAGVALLFAARSP